MILGGNKSTSKSIVTIMSHPWNWMHIWDRYFFDTYDAFGYGFSDKYIGDADLWLDEYLYAELLWS